MPAIKNKDAKKNVEKKGFVNVPCDDHHKLVFYFNGKPTSLYLKISHSNEDVANIAIRTMSATTRLEQSKVKDLLRCPFSEKNMIDHYEQLVREHQINVKKK